MNRIICFVFIIMIILVCLANCGNRSDDTGDRDTRPQAVFSGVDATGVKIELTAFPERIISLAPSNTEILFALGLGDRLTGRTRFCNYPPQTGNIDIVSGFVDVNIERIVSLHPDIVLAVRGNPEKVIRELRRLGIKVFALDPEDINDVINTIVLTGKITGETDSAQKLARKLTDRLNRIKKIVAAIPRDRLPKVFYGDWKPPVHAAGAENPIDSLITMAGGINIAADAGVPWPKYSVERILAHNPDIILSGFKKDEDLDKNVDTLRKEMKSDPLWSKIKAVQNNRVYFIDEDIVMRPGPRMVEALELMTGFFHPDLFADLLTE